MNAALYKYHRILNVVYCRDDGMGLAAPQVGLNLRLMVFNVEGVRGRGEELILANPRIVSCSGQEWEHVESCLSFKTGSELVEGRIKVRLVPVHWNCCNIRQE
jgi:peptide deformylase